MEMAAIDCDRSIAVRFHYDGTIPEGNQHSYMQVALLHTNAYVAECIGNQLLCMDILTSPLPRFLVCYTCSV